jgi:mycofactocin precursor
MLNELTAQAVDQAVDHTATEADETLTAEDLVEEVSIDGMCGVY